MMIFEMNHRSPQNGELWRRREVFYDESLGYACNTIKQQNSENPGYLFDQTQATKTC